jgi:hypothetical protein
MSHLSKRVFEKYRTNLGLFKSGVEKLKQKKCHFYMQIDNFMIGFLKFYRKQILYNLRSNRPANVKLIFL